ncbi:MAG: AmmeMemoRadiSam system protein B [Anaerolineae bacterium]|nr:AmmeMemoRadiSam system protein B [Anaerolineae bacterium]
MRREPIVAGMFYPAEPERCRAELARYLEDARKAVPEGRYFAGLVPHAGWSYSGPTAARTFAALAASGMPDTLVILGAVHVWGVTRAAVFAAGTWITPLGALQVDRALADRIVGESGGLVVEDPRAHTQEHSIEVQLPFVRYLFPQATVVPLMVPPSEDAIDVGEAVARAVRLHGGSVYILGSSDLTHYGPRYGFAPRGMGAGALAWARENDRRLLDAVAELRVEEALERALEDRSACGGGAIAALVAAARDLGATRGVILEQTTSHDVHPMGAPSDFVGYAAVVF